jgi:hypothetical protein
MPAHASTAPRAIQHVDPWEFIGASMLFSVRNATWTRRDQPLRFTLSCFHTGFSLHIFAAPHSTSSSLLLLLQLLSSSLLLLPLLSSYARRRSLCQFGMIVR